MTGFPLFNVDDLVRAFGLIVSDRIAAQWAGEWFQRHSDQVNPAGFFLYEEWWAKGEDTAVDGQTAGLVTSGGAASRTYEHLRRLSEQEKFELLMRFSDLHLNLLALTSPDLFARISVARRDTASVAEQRRQDSLRLVEALRDEGGKSVRAK